MFLARGALGVLELAVLGTPVNLALWEWFLALRDLRAEMVAADLSHNLAEVRLALRAQFERVELWENLPAIAGAVQACHRLHDAGYELVCVTALEERFRLARQRNLRALGFPIRRVVATGHAEGERSPKADAIAALRPVAFVDDYIAYMRGMPTEVHTALVLRAPNGSPNVGDELRLARSTHQDLAAFADHWLGA